MGIEDMEAWSPEKTLNYIQQLGSDLNNSAEEIKTMLQIAQERGITTDISRRPELRNFEALGEYEKMLVDLRGKLGTLKTELFNQGVRITEEEMDQHRINSVSGL